MKKIFIPILFVILLPIAYSCSNLQKAVGYVLNERDAEQAIRELLQIGSRDGVQGAFSKDRILNTLFPEPVSNVLKTMQQLGLSNEIDRFTTTLSSAAEKTASNSIPIFVGSIHNMKFRDAMRIVKDGNTAATDYLRTSVGDSLRRSITPVMQSVLDEYKLNEQWNNITKPAKVVVGNKLNLDLANLMAGLVSEVMFQKIAEKEREVRTNAAARTTPLLQRVFSRVWN
ncbi:MAG TPA: DUF4197 domain-containing protein [Chitinophagaceae bacterium]|nr:DUF4197 domain-containing protein [Chitinophagaceae bacterium]